MPFPKFALALVATALATPAHAYRVSVWVPPWDTRALTTMQMNAGNVSESNPVWYILGADGSILKVANAENPSLRAALTGTEIIPTIQNVINGRFDGPGAAAIVATGEGRERHAEAIVQLVVTNAYQGIDLDYESMPATSRAGFTAFVQLLAEKLHSAGKQLSVTVHPKTRETTSAGSGSHDYAALGAAADTIKIMAYNFHWSGSVAGPITPLGWLDQVVTYAETQIPAHKIIVGLPWYGYDWLATQGKSVLWVDATAIAQQNAATVERDASSGEATFAYSGRTVFFQDATAFRTKTDAIIARHPQIGGFAVWRVGGEDPDIWSVMARLKGSSTSTPVQPAPEPTPSRRRAVRH